MRADCCSVGGGDPVVSGQFGGGAGLQPLVGGFGAEVEGAAELDAAGDVAVAAFFVEPAFPGGGLLGGGEGGDELVEAEQLGERRPAGPVAFPVSRFDAVNDPLRDLVGEAVDQLRAEVLQLRFWLRAAAGAVVFSSWVVAGGHQGIHLMSGCGWCWAWWARLVARMAAMQASLALVLSSL